MNIFVSGGSRGIGRAIVLRLLSAGHHVAFTFNKGNEEAQDLLISAREQFPKQSVMSYKCDIRNPAQVEEVVDIASNELGDLHGLVCNAGITGNALTVNMTNQTWDDVIGTNLNGSFYLCRQVLPSFLANRFGRIVLISSVVRHGSTGQAAYAASKMGLVGLGQTLAKEYGSKNITCNIVAPGYIDTEMATTHASPKVLEFWKEYCPAGRSGTADEVANVVNFLCSVESSYVNGVEIPVNGGMDWLP